MVQEICKTYEEINWEWKEYTRNLILDFVKSEDGYKKGLIKEGKKFEEFISLLTKGCLLYYGDVKLDLNDIIAFISDTFVASLARGTSDHKILDYIKGTGARYETKPILDTIKHWKGLELKSLDNLTPNSIPSVGKYYRINGHFHFCDPERKCAREMNYDSGTCCEWELNSYKGEAVFKILSINEEKGTYIISMGGEYCDKEYFERGGNFLSPEEYKLDQLNFFIREGLLVEISENDLKDKKPFIRSMYQHEIDKLKKQIERYESQIKELGA